MGYFVWQALPDQLRETMQRGPSKRRRRRRPDSNIIPAIPESAAKTAETKSSPNPPLWDQAGIQDFAFTERSGREGTKADLLGHPWLISFIFTPLCRPCVRR